MYVRYIVFTNTFILHLTTKLWDGEHLKLSLVGQAYQVILGVALICNDTLTIEHSRRLSMRYFNSHATDIRYGYALIPIK